MKNTLLFCFCIIAISGFSQNIIQDSFESYNSNAQLSGQGAWTNNSSLPGGLGTCVGLGCVNALVADRNMAVSGYGSTTKAFSLTPSTDGCGRSFTPFTENGDLYIGMIINISAAQSSPIDFFRVLSGGNFTTTFRMLVQPTSGSTYSIGIRKGDTSNPTVYTANSYNYNTDYLLIFKYSQLAGTNDDTISLYANPNYSAGESGNAASATNFAGNDQSGNIDRVAFRQNAGPAGMPSGFVSLISIAKTWETLTFELANQEFEKFNFVLNYSNIKNGILGINSSNQFSTNDLRIYDISGKKLFSKSINLEKADNEIQVDAIFTAGVYIVEITSADNQKFVKKIIIN